MILVVGQAHQAPVAPIVYSTHLSTPPSVSHHNSPGSGSDIGGTWPGAGTPDLDLTISQNLEPQYLDTRDDE